MTVINLAHYKAQRDKPKDTTERMWWRLFENAVKDSEAVVDRFNMQVTENKSKIEGDK